jgi:hypothetical protein
MKCGDTQNRKNKKKAVKAIHTTLALPPLPHLTLQLPAAKCKSSPIQPLGLVGGHVVLRREMWGVAAGYFTVNDPLS